MPSMRILSQDVRHEIRAFREVSRLRFDLQDPARSIPMPSVQNLIADHIDRLELSLVSNVLDEGVERFSIHVTAEGR